MKVHIIGTVIDSEHTESRLKKISKAVILKSVSKLGMEEEVMSICKEIAEAEAKKIKNEDYLIGVKFDEIDEVGDNVYSLKLLDKSPNPSESTIIVFHQSFNITEKSEKIYVLCDYNQSSYADYMYDDDIELRGINFGLNSIKTSKEEALKSFASIEACLKETYEEKLEEVTNDGGYVEDCRLILSNDSEEIWEEDLLNNTHLIKESIAYFSCEESAICSLYEIPLD